MEGIHAMLSLIVPCFNESEVLELTYQTLAAEARQWDMPIELVFVDDGSRDATWQIIEGLAARDARVRGLRMSRNFGHQAAVGAGLAAAAGDAVVVLDADLQDPPELIATLIERWRQGYDVVAARRNRRHGESAFKKALGFAFYRLLARITDVDIPKDTGDFALLDRSVVDVLVSCREHSMFWRGLRCYAGFRHTLVCFDRPSRAAGKSKYTLRKLMGLALSGLLSYSAVPPRLGLYVGSFMLLITLLTAAANLACALFSDVTLPISSLGMGMFFLGSVQLLCVGVCGEYLSRIYDEVRNRPRWVIAQQAGLAPGGQLNVTPDSGGALARRLQDITTSSTRGQPVGPAFRGLPSHQDAHP
jgi:dolichol-phosphate mannosyltransferase